MNHVYRLVWSALHNAWAVVAENAAAHGKKSRAGRVLLAATLLGMVPAASAEPAPPAATALPQGGQVAAGQATINQNGALLNIDQSSQKAILNWQAFNIGSAATVNFNQPNASSVALNRVVGADASQIYGRLNANGQVFLVNTNGILFGQGAQANVGGLVASTLNISDSDFLAGNYRFTRDGSTASISNAGKLAASEGGYVALLATDIHNTGTLVAQKGTVALAAGEAVTLNMQGSVVSVQVDPATVNAQIENRQLIEADGGTVLMTARAANALLTASINNSGTLSASSLINDGGTIRLVASTGKGAAENGYIANTGTIKADGARGGTVGLLTGQLDDSGEVSAQGTNHDGGRIGVSANRVAMTNRGRLDASGASDGGEIKLSLSNDAGGGAYLSGQLVATGESGLGGAIQVTGRELNLIGAQIDAHGATGGGSAKIGGDYQGGNPGIPNAQKVTFSHSHVDVSATDEGDGGTAIVWSDDTTRFDGSIDARGAHAGVKSTANGGLVEVSGKQNLGFAGDVWARTLLLDPTNLSIVDPGNGVAIEDFIDPDSTATGFASTVYQLGSGKLLVFSPNATSGGGSGAAYVYQRDRTLTTLMRDTGGYANFTALGNDKYVIANGGANSGLGAVGYFDGNGTVVGRMDATNALIGNSYYGQGWGGSLLDLGGGNYASLMANSNANIVMRGAMKFFNATNAATELVGTVGPTTALVGTNQGTSTNLTPNGAYVAVDSYGDVLGYQVNTASNWISGRHPSTLSQPKAQSVGGGNWIFSSPLWGRDVSNNVLGAMTVVTPSAIAAGNLKGTDLSLVSFVGNIGSGLGAGLGSGAYSEIGAGSNQWIHNAGYALIPVDPASLASFTPGNLNSGNALMLTDGVTNVTQLASTGNFVLIGGTSVYAGGYARQLNYSGNFSSTFHGSLSASDSTNSILGSSSQYLGNLGVVDLGNGNYLVKSGYASPNYWTFVDGSTGTSGITSLNSTNSLSTSLSNTGNVFGETVLSNGSYIIQVGGSNDPNFPSSLPDGALFYGNGTARQAGDLQSAANSLLGDGSFTRIQSASIKDLGNGAWAAVGSNYVTWGNGSVVRIGTLDASKALAGTNGFVNLGNSAFATAVPTAVGGAGAIARIDATNATVPTLSSANALIGSSATDALGSNGAVDFGNGVGAFLSPNWNGTAGAVTTITAANAATRLVGTLGTSNSLVGSTAGDAVGANTSTLNSSTVSPFQRIGSTSIYALTTSTWGGNKGAVTLFDPAAANGLTGVLGVGNSLVGNTAGDHVGLANAPGSSGADADGILFRDLGGGRYAMYTRDWQNASAQTVGALTWLTPTSGAVGVVGNGNSLTGLQGAPKLTSLGSGYYSLLSANWNTGAGAMTVFQPGSEPLGAINSSNSLISSNPSSGSLELADASIVSLGGNLRAVLTPGWNANTGAITAFDLTSGLSGTIGSAISLVGSTGSELGKTLTLLPSGNLVVTSPGWNGSKGAATWIETTSVGMLNALRGTLAVGASNSLYGSTAGDRVGSGGVTALSNDVFVVLSPNFRLVPSDTPGAVTLGNGLTNGIRGAVSPVNSYLASTGITTPLPFVVPYGATGATISTGNALSNVDIIYPVAMPQGSSTLAYSNYLNQTVTMLPSTITALLDAGTSVTLQATNRLYVGSPIQANNPNGNGGDLTLQTQSGDVMLGADARITTDNGNLLILAGRNFINGASASPFNTGTGNWMVYANDPATSTVGNLSFDFKEYGKTYGQTLDGVTARTALGLGPGNAVVFAQQPSLSMPSVNDFKTYDGTTALGAPVSITGLVDGDLLDHSFAYTDIHADPNWNPKDVVLTVGSGGVTSSVATGQKPVYGYLNQPAAGSTQTFAGAGLIVPFSYQVDLAGPISKVYDGTDAAPTGMAYQFSVPVWQTAAPDQITIDTSQVTGSFSDANWNPAANVTAATQFAASGTLSVVVPQGASYLATDYSVQFNNNVVTGSITPKSIVGGVTASNKVYDGTTAATLTGTASLTGVLQSSYNSSSGASLDDVQFSGSVSGGTFADANAGVGKTVNVTGLSLTGADASNYTVGALVSTADITPKSLSVAGSSVVAKQYDGTTAATINVGTLSGFVGSEIVTATGAGVFASPNVGTHNVATTYTLVNGGNGGLASNYSLSGETLSGTINPAYLALIVGSLTGSTSKVYDGTTTATLSAGNFLLSGWVNGDGTDVTVTKTSGTYDNANAAINKTVTVSLSSGDFAATSTNLSNYGLPTTASGAIGTITPKTLTVSGTTAVGKTYDGSSTAAISVGSLSGFVGSETVTATASGAFDSANAGSRSATASYTLVNGSNGGLANNYQLANTSGHAATISAKTVTVTGLAASDKTYDGTTSTTIGNWGSVSTGVGSETLVLNHGTAAFSDANANNGKTVTATGYSLADGTGLAGNYALASTSATTQANIAKATLTVSGTTALNKVYDGNTTAAITVGTLSGLVGSETVTATATGVFDGANAGSRSATATYTLADGSGLANNYQLADTSGHAASITAKSLTVTGLAASNKIYDGTTAVTIGNWGSVSTGVGSETLVLNHGTAAFSDANANNGKTVTASGYSLADGSGLASNYALTSTSAATQADIAKATLTVTGSTASNKAYDGSTTAVITVGTLSGFVGSETVTATASGVFNSANTGSRTASASYTLADGSGLANNYQLANTSGHSATITAKALTVTGTTASSKVYNRDATASISVGTLSGLVGSETLGVTATGLFDSMNVGSRSAAATYTLADGTNGGLASNYTLASTTGHAANITPFALSISGITASNKVYDGNTSVSLAGSASLSGVFSGDTVAVAGAASGVFINKNVGNNKSIQVSGLTLSGADAGNYTVGTLSATANITTKALTASYSGSNKVYDATTAATVSGASSDIITGDTVSFSQSAAFATKDAGTNKQIDVSGITLGGTDAGNYSLQNATATTTANIAQASLSVTGATAANKVYDATTSATVSGGGVIALGSDSLSLSAANATFANKHVGNGKVVSTAYTLSGTDAANYVLVQPTGLTANITAKALTASYSGSSKVYDATTAVTVSGTSGDIIAGDTVSFSQSAVFVDKNAGTNKQINVTSIALGGADAGNYSLQNSTATTQANIAQASLSVTGATAANKVYDASTTATVTGGGVTALGSDSLTLSAANATFADKNVGSNKVVTTAYTLSGTDAANYALTQPTGLTANITAKALTASYSGSSKVYDATTAVTVNGASSDIITGDTVSFSQSAAFATKDAGTNKQINVTSIALGGADAGNYSLQNASASTTADIGKATLTVSGSTAAGKVYDGGTTASITVGTLSGFIGSETVTATATGVFDSANAGSRTATASYSLANGTGLAGNYQLADTTGHAASISAKTVTVTGLAASNKTYDGTTAVTIGNWGSVSTGVGSETLTLNHGTATFSDANAGTGKTVTASGYSLANGSGLAGNYALATTSASTTADIAQAALTMTAQNGNKAFSDLDPTLNAVYSGFVNGETSSVLSGLSLTRAAGEAAGTYVITPSASATNYTITPVAGVFTVAPADQLVVQVGNAAQTYGASTSGFTVTSAKYYSSSGNALRTLAISNTGNQYTVDDGLGTTASFTLAANAPQTSSSGNLVVGNYGITGTGFTVSGGNFSSNSFANGNLAVTPTTLTASASGVSKVYDGNTSMAGASLGLTGVISADQVTVSGVGAFSQSNAGSNLGYTLGNLALSGVDAGNYVLGSSSLNGSNGAITAKTVSVTGLVADNKVYDGSAAATLSNWGAVSTGVGSETLVLNHGTAAFSDANAGNGKTVTASGYSLADGSGQASNYVLASNSATALADIAKAALTVSGTIAAGKVYDGGTTASITVGTLSGFIGSETVTATATGVFDSANAGSRTAKASYTLANGSGLASNYQLADTTGLNATITPKALTVAGTTASGKSYDGSTSATITVGTLSGLVGSETVTATATGVFDSANAGSRTATASYTLADGSGLANNYQLANTTGHTATITPKALTVVGTTASGKVYDGSSWATITVGTLSGLVGSETVTATAAGVFNSANAGSRTATATYSLSNGLNGGLSSNYQLADTTGLTANITAKTVTVSGLAANNKTYDGTTTASIGNWGSVSTGVGSETLTLNHGTAAFSDANAGTGKTVTASGYSLADGTGLASNYALASTSASTQASITPKVLTVTGLTASNKAYDGTTVVTIGNWGAVSTGVGGETLTLNHGTATFSDANAGTGKTVTASGYSLANGSGLAGNYALATTSASTTADIAQAALTMTAQNGSKAFSDLDPTLNAVYSGFVNGETSSVLSGFSLTRAAGEAAGTYVITPSASATNYTITPVAGVFTVAPADQLVVQVGNAAQTYGATTSGFTVTSAKYYSSTGNALRTLTISNTGNQFTVDDGLGTTASFTLAASAPQTSGSGNLTVGNYGISGTGFSVLSGGNFSSNSFANGNLAVTPATLTASASGVSKVYDGNTSMAGISLGLTGVIGVDQVTVGGVGAFAQSNAGSNLGYTVGNLALTGADAGNYVLGSSSLSGSNASITAKTVSISGLSAGNKTYDGTTAATINNWGAVSTGVGSETLVLNHGTAAFSDANAGTGKTVTASGYSLANGTGLAGNYVLASNSATAQADITPKSVTISGLTADNKVYDGSTATTISGTASLVGVIAGDAVSVGGTASASFADKNVGTGKAVSINGLTLTGQQAGNYTASALASTADISAKALTLTGIVANDKVFDGTVLATLAYTGDLNGIIGNEQVVTDTGGLAALFNDAAVGSSKTVTVTGIALNGADAQNYTLTGSPWTTTADITSTTSASNNPATLGGLLNSLTQQGGGNSAVGNMNTPPAGSLQQSNQPLLVAVSTGSPAYGTATGGVVRGAAPMPSSVAGTGVMAGSANVVGNAALEQGGFISVRQFGVMNMVPGQSTRMPLPSDTFVHRDGADKLKLSASLEDGSPLPGWMSFDAGSGSFSLRPPSGLKGEIKVVVTAVDAKGNSASTEVVFSLEPNKSVR